MSTVKEVTTDEEFNQHISSLPSSALTVLYFHTPWAAPCAQMSTVLSTLAATYPATSPPTTSWLSINAEELPDISENYDVTAVPYLVLLRNNTVLDTVSGSDATKVRAAIEKHANAPSGGNQLPPLQKVTPKPQHEDDSRAAPSQNNSAAAPEDSPEPTSKEDLHKRLSELVKAAPVMLFMKGTPSSPQCGFSRQLVALLREKSVKYGFFNILADDEVRQGLKEFADWPTFPQLWVDGELVGGLDIVKEEVSNDPQFFQDYSVKATATAS